MLFLIPAHNEADCIHRTLDSVAQQTILDDVDVVVVCDNCTDATPEIAGRYPFVTVFETEDNDARKAGALNQAWAEYGDGHEVLACCDADTQLRPDFLEEGRREIEGDPDVGGVCARFYARPRKGVVKRLQRLEYARQDERRALWGMSVPVLSGSGTFFRAEALRELGPKPWSETSIVEDFEITIRLRLNGWETRAGKRLKVTTGTPDTVRDLWRQRKRWSRGTLEHLCEFGFNRATIHGWFGFLRTFLFVGVKVFWLVMLTMILLGTLQIGWHWFWISPILVLLLDRATSLYSLDDAEAKDYLTSFATLPEELFYQHMREAWMLYTTFLVATSNTNRTW